MKVMRSNIASLIEVLNNPKYFEMPISSYFRYMITSNIDILTNELHQIDSKFKAPEMELEFENKRQLLLSKHKIKIPEDYKNLSTESQKEFEIDMEALNTEYSDLLKEIKELDKEKKKYLDELVDLPLKLVHIDHVPNISNNTQNHWGVWNAIKPLIVD